MTVDPLEPWLRRWRLTLDGEAFRTPFHNWLAPVRWRGQPAMLKVAGNQEEREGARLMAWYGGDGAAAVFAHAGPALLLERACGPWVLREMAIAGDDAAATEILCRTVARLHATRVAPPPPMLAPLPVWFRQLEPAAAAHGGVLVQSAAAARGLLSSPREPRVLHGDIHHDNVLGAGPQGWLAIDPKGLHGERAFDYANIFCNPVWRVAVDAERLLERAAIVAELAGLERNRLLQWVLAYAGLSAAWTIGDGGDPALPLAVAALAVAAIG